MTAPGPALVRPALFAFPEGAAFGRTVPKSRVYAHGKAGAAVKALFVRQVDRIAWLYKLAPETIHLSPRRSAPEIQIFGLFLKEGALKRDVLRCIDQAIPFPIIFELRHDDRVKAVAAHKRPSAADGAKWVAGEYFETEWMPASAPRRPLPVVPDLKALYAALLSILMPFPARPAEGLRAMVERMEKIRLKQRELEKCEALLRREKQFNRKVEMNAERRELKRQLESLTRPTAEDSRQMNK